MIQKAFEQRWPIEPMHKKAIVHRLLRIIADPQSSPREITAAAKALIAAEKQNQDDEHAKVDEFNERILSIARRCGVNVDLLGFGEGTAGGAEARIESVDGTTD